MNFHRKTIFILLSFVFIAFANEYPSLRIQGDFSSLPSTPFTKYLQDQLAPAVFSFFQGALQVKSPVAGLLKQSTATVCGVKTPSSLKEGVEADLFLIFDSVVTSSLTSPASSQYCTLASGSRRPTIGRISLNLALLSDPEGNELAHEKNIYFLLHEVTHILGFHSNLFQYFTDNAGAKRTDQILSAATRLGETKVLNIPALTNRIRKFFGCESIAGAYLENTGDSTVKGTHFERRMFPLEVMSHGFLDQQAYSEFTLAVLEGSGWYVADYSFADPYWFGQGQGCGFLLDSCLSTGFNFAEFCDGTARGCTGQGRGGGKCAFDSIADGCRFIKPNVNYDCENSEAVNYARLPSLQAFGRDAGSKCFSGTLSTSSNAASSSFCFKYTCAGSGVDTRLEVHVGKKTVTCGEKGQISVSGYKGTIDCPDPVEFCNTVGKAACPRGCMGRGQCENGACVCKEGFSGRDCGFRG